jgi:hypothetical protein
MARNKAIVPEGKESQAIDELLNRDYWNEQLSDQDNFEVQTDDTDGNPEAGWLRIVIGPDSDVHIFATDNAHGEPQEVRIRFRTYHGGGHSLRVRRACLILARAMQLDAQDPNR